MHRQDVQDPTKGKHSPTAEGVAYLRLKDTEVNTQLLERERLSAAGLYILNCWFLGYQPSPFFVPYEVDAALDNTNVAKVLVTSFNEFQFIVINLKSSLYEKSDSLVGVHRDQDANSSWIPTLDLKQDD
ncbi:Structural maintenance of chromosomes protein 1 [Tulasnella sp. UAMH 9824]|nr:Structural maintenance of chromosomes protein 1 [Tulasnella sp. UAMH 9824]